LIPGFVVVGGLYDGLEVVVVLKVVVVVRTVDDDGLVVVVGGVGSSEPMHHFETKGFVPKMNVFVEIILRNSLK